MPTDPRTPFDTWQSRGPVPAPTSPTVAFLRSHDGDAYAVQFGPFTGPLRATKHAAESDADLLAGAVGPSLAAAQRAAALRSDPDALDELLYRMASPRSAALRVLRYVLDGDATPAPAEGPTLDRLGGEMAVVADGSGEL